MSGHEVELKFEIDPAGISGLHSEPLLSGSLQNIKEQTSTYFDTADFKLREAGFSLRVRFSGDAYVQTVKRSGIGAGLFDRPEWETAIDGPQPDFAAINATALGKLMTRKIAERLRAVITSTVKRTTWLLSHSDSQIEVVLDEGRVAAAEQDRPLNELEIEVRSGSVNSALAIARQLGEEVPLRLGVLTKAERGYALADGTLDRVAKAAPVEIRPEMSVAQAFAVVAYACLKHFRLNEDLLVRERDPAALHQARVAMRRLRSALSLFRPVLLDQSFAPLREELRWFTAQLGEARNLDVFIERSGDNPASAAEQLRNERERAYDEVIAVIGSKRFRLLMIDFVAWTETGKWREHRKAQAPIASFASKRLERLWQKIIERGADLEQLSEEERHRVRIDVKKMRYATEFMGALYPRTSAYKRFVRALEKLQEQLGYLNDLATARLLTTSLEPNLEGHVQADDGNAAIKHLAAAQKAFRKLIGLDHFWG